MSLEGLYEQLINQMLNTHLDRLRSSGREVERRKLDDADAAEVLARYVATELARVLRAVPTSHRRDQQVALVNSLLARIRELLPSASPADLDVISPGEQLLSVHPPGRPIRRPITPMSISELLTGAQGEPRLGLEIEAELASADRVDILVSFIKWRGLQRLMDALSELSRRGCPVRVLSTTYMGASDAEALDWLARLQNTSVRISFDHRRTRLHAKAWLFYRASGFSTAYVGSANVSASALDSGLEWTLKACEPDAPHIIRKFEGAFESLWQDGEFERYSPDEPQMRKRLDASLIEGRGGHETPMTPPTFFTLEPYPFQREILDALTDERVERGFHHNLIVAATGTGKTMLAAFDYARQIGADGLRPRLLFVAHREELLKQALESFRHVMRDYSFGELLGGGHEPTSHDHLFATIQSVRSRGLADQHPADFWDYVVVDEFHHAAADSYRELLDQLQPRILLGLTATPERTDGLDILHWFGGRIAAEIRLWDALERQLLAPFDYYGIHDGVDLSDVAWKRGGYDLGSLSDIYTGNDLRAGLVIREFSKRYGNPHQARALGFCVSVEHAAFMAQAFNAAGIPAISVSGETDPDQRDTAISRLRRRQVNVIFTCDLYNEGVDIPEADCLLMLRPTESPTVFLQQLGRGLRRHADKSNTLVLDFIGNAHRRFRFDMKLRALTGVARGHLPRALEDGFPSLPAACHFQLDRMSREIVLENLKQSVQARRQQLASELKHIAQDLGRAPTMAEYLGLSGYELRDIYDRADSWTELRRLAGLLPADATEEESALGKRFVRLLHIDEPHRLKLYRAMADKPASDLDGADQKRMLMLSLRLAPRPRRTVTMHSGIEAIRRFPELRHEFVELCDVLLDRARATPDVEQVWPLALHRRYVREDEVLTAAGRWTETEQPPLREGRLWMEESKTELMFVTINKSEKRFSPTTRYEDYAISDTLFHWQSQSTTSEDSPSGKRYRSGGARFLLFVRENQGDAYTYLGPVTYVSHEGSRPMSITWRLQTPMPAGLLRRYATLRSA